jgi:uncharacterized protein (DUF305 family)
MQDSARWRLVNMRRLSLLFAVLLLATSCSRHDESHSRETATTSTVTATTAATAAQAAPYDLQFLDTMSHHHQMAIDMVKAAEGRFAHKELSEAGKKIVEDQQKEIAQMKAWRDQWYPAASPAVNMNMPGMSSSMNMDMSHMTSMSGNQLDLMFIDMMIPHHDGAVAMANEALTRAERAEIKDLARIIIDAQTREIAQFRQWRQTWAGAK